MLVTEKYDGAWMWIVITPKGEYHFPTKKDAKKFLIDRKEEGYLAKKVLWIYYEDE